MQYENRCSDANQCDMSLSPAATLDQLLDLAVNFAEGKVALCNSDLFILKRSLKHKVEWALGPGDQLRMPGLSLKKGLDGVASVTFGYPQVDLTPGEGT